MKRILISMMILGSVSQAHASRFGCSGDGDKGGASYFAELLDMPDRLTITEIFGEDSITVPIPVTTTSTHWPLVYTQVGQNSAISGVRFIMNSDQTAQLAIAKTPHSLQNIQAPSMKCVPF